MFQQRSVFGIMNLIRCWFGAMPCCHGDGGLAGQYKFGGRSGGCVALLGVLLLFDGIELAMCSRDMNSKEESVAMLICTAVSLVGSSATLGFLCGFLLLRARRLVDCSNLVPQLSAIICRSNIELELSQCWSVNMDDLFDKFI
ncbi:Molybdate transporter 1 [Abeliophyllum distichum]|uniref:Molybdate transporter 1 n=1 Tax=Abeliophyllum distichum TaxID=126358 RepID=A0ABD1UR36_9LAMI